VKPVAVMRLALACRSRRRDSENGLGFTIGWRKVGDMVSRVRFLERKKYTVNPSQNSIKNRTFCFPLDKIFIIRVCDSPLHCRLMTCQSSLHRRNYEAMSFRRDVVAPQSLAWLTRPISGHLRKMQFEKLGEM
jgi:hypothetical protein